MKFSILSMMIVFLSGCLEIEVTAPTSVTQNQVFEFSATHQNNDGAVNYLWTVNGQTIDQDDQGFYVFTEQGAYTLSAYAVDEAGNEDRKEVVIDVLEAQPLSTDFSFKVNVSDQEGAAIEGATVSVNGVSVVTDTYGLSLLEPIKQTSVMMLKVEKSGYLTQSYRYDFAQAETQVVANVTLQAISLDVQQADAQTANELSVNELKTTISFGADAFVLPDGSPATGNFDVTITPINPRTVNGAFLGGGQALTQQGEIRPLISAGMADFQFSQEGVELQLASGQTATIEMDLSTLQGDDGKAYQVGDQIPMWWFDQANGLWIEDGVGTIVASDSSETGMRLRAEVNHFTTWNWDYVPEGSENTQVRLSCLKNGQTLQTGETCQMTLASETTNRQFLVGAQGVTIINIGSNITFDVTALIEEPNGVWFGQRQYRTSTGNNEIAVNMQQKSTKTGYIQCSVVNSSSTRLSPCDVRISSSLSDLEFSTEGATNYRKGFEYLPGDTLSVRVAIPGGYELTRIYDTSRTNGTLDLSFVFDIEVGTLTCIAGLNGTDYERFPCRALVDEQPTDNKFIIWEQNFDDETKQAPFSFSATTDFLNFSVASQFNTGVVGENSRGPYAYGDLTQKLVDVVADGVNVEISYDVTSDDLYDIRCLMPNGTETNCRVTLYSPMEEILFDDMTETLDDTERTPSWIVGSAYIGNIQDVIDGFGQGYIPGEGNYTSEYVVDQVNNRITFHLDEEIPH
jgi:hypothetical protein